MHTNLKKIAPEADGILKDGQVLRVPHTMMDAAQVAVADAVKPAPFVADHHRPNSAVLTDDQKREANERHAARDKKLSDMWKNPEPIFAANFLQGGSGQVMPQTSGQALDPGLASAPGSAVNVVGAASVAELDALQVANQAKYNARIEAAYKGAK